MWGNVRARPSAGRRRCDDYRTPLPPPPRRPTTHPAAHAPCLLFVLPSLIDPPSSCVVCVTVSVFFFTLESCEMTHTRHRHAGVRDESRDRTMNDSTHNAAMTQTTTRTHSSPLTSLARSRLRYTPRTAICVRPCALPHRRTAPQVTHATPPRAGDTARDDDDPARGSPRKHESGEMRAARRSRPHPVGPCASPPVPHSHALRELSMHIHT